MCARPAFADHDLPSERPIQRSRSTRNAKYMGVKDAKAALDIILRPSFQLWKLALGRGVLTASKRPQKTTIGDSSSDKSSITPKKMVRFHEQPITITRKSFFQRYRKDSGSSPARPCLVLRGHVDVCPKPPKPQLEADCQSVYEDCPSDYPGFLVDLQTLEGDERSNTRPPKHRRRSEFYETESGIAMFDRSGYANYCLSRWLEMQREEARAPKKLVFEDPALLPWPSRTLPPPASNPLDGPCTTPLLSAPVRRISRPLPWRAWRCIEDELQNAFVVLTIGLVLHICLFLFLLYDILTRGLIPSDD